MNIYTGLLFQHGYIQDAELAVSLAQPQSQTQAQVPSEPVQEGPAKPSRRKGRLATFHGHAVSFVCGATALSPFR